MTQQERSQNICCVKVFHKLFIMYKINILLCTVSPLSKHTQDIEYTVLYNIYCTVTILNALIEQH